MWFERIERARPWKRLMDERPLERHHVRTRDGWELSLARVRPSREPLVSADTPPVLLLHGLGSNRHSLDLAERSLARWLAERGHDVWLPDLRGHGESPARNYQWGFDDYLFGDVPAILDGILRRTGHERINWVGHSMGGILLMAHGALSEDARVARGVTIASALDYTQGGTGFAKLAGLTGVLERSPLDALPFGTLAHALSPVIGRARVAERFHMWPSNVEPKLARRVFARCFGPIPSNLAAGLATTFQPGGFRLADGTLLLERAAENDIETLAIAGSKDMQVSVEAVEHAARVIGGNVRVRTFGRAHGDASEYGHFDLVMGKSAPDEVWPAIADFLER